MNDLRNNKNNAPTFAGELSFFRRTFSTNIKNANAIVWGIPFDAATSNRPGARFGPQAIRRASAILDNDPQYPFYSTLFEKMEIIDYGDCNINYRDFATLTQNIEHETSKILTSKSNPYLLTLGGDHFITYPLLKAHVKKYGPLALVQFDAHQDTWNYEGGKYEGGNYEGGGVLDHGTMIKRAVDDGLILPDKSIQVGIRTIASDTCGIEILDSLQTEQMTAQEISQKILQRTANAKTYLTFDIDCLDPAFAPGTGTPVAGGLATIKILSILNGLRELDIVGSDVVEVAPPYDHADITALAAATIAMYMLGLLERKTT